MAHALHAAGLSHAEVLARALVALQRALHDAGTSFRDELDFVRKTQAQRYLADASYSGGEVAFLVGFEDPTSFSRAFRAWNGVSPSRFRLQRNLDTKLGA